MPRAGSRGSQSTTKAVRGQRGGPRAGDAELWSEAAQLPTPVWRHACCCVLRVGMGARRVAKPEAEAALGALAACARFRRELSSSCGRDMPVGADFVVGFGHG